MIDTMRQYADYRPSGDDWLGKVPGHWRSTSLGAISTRKSTRNRPDLPLLSVLREKGVVLRSSLSQDENHNFIPDDLSNYQVANEGDLVVNKMKAWQGSVGVAPQDGIVSPAYYVFELADIKKKYAHRLLRSHLYADFFGRASDGVRIGQWDLRIPAMKRIPVLIPPPDEQDSIARYLDEMDRRIARFISNRRRLIDVLNEQKQAIINRTVTLGLQPDVPLKPSGVDWVGDIPKHWEVKRLRNVATIRFSNVDKHSHPNELQIRLCNYTDVYKNEEITADLPFMKATVTPSELSMFKLRVGDVIITKDSEDWLDIGVPAVVASSAEDLVCGYHLAILRPNKNQTHGAFLSNALRSVSARAQLSLSAKGVTRYGISQGAIKALKLPVPPYEEQVENAAYIKAKTQELETALSKARDEISLILEYRTRLISDVVTGKVDVRHLAQTPGSSDVEDLTEALEPLDEEPSEFDEEAIDEEVSHADD